MNTSLDDHERRISHSLYGGLEGLDDNLMPRQGMMPRTVGKTSRLPVGCLTLITSDTSQLHDIQHKFYHDVEG